VIFGLFLDGWRHINLADGRAGAFLTIWHVPLYIGITITGTWIATRNQDMRNLMRGRFDIAAIPRGYRLGVLAMGTLSCGTAGDAVWHTFYGIEQGIERTLSPFHIVLFTSATMILSSPLRAAWARADEEAPSFGRFFPVLVSLTFSAAVVTFIVQFLNGFLPWTSTVPDIAATGAAGENARIVGTATVLMTNMIVLAPILLAFRRWRPPFGFATVLLPVIAALDGSIFELKRGWTVAAAFLAGLVADILIKRLDASPARVNAQRVVAAVTPLVLWSAYFVALRLAYGISWERNVWMSSVLLAGLSGLALSALMASSATASAAVEDAEDDAPALEQLRAA
jgi:hypothetical protein